MAKLGAKGKYEYWLTKEGKLRLWGWALDGLTDAQIAKNMGIAEATLYRWKVDFQDIRESLQAPKDIADRAIENALYKKALAGDTTAMIFWLKNRKRLEWRDRIENNIVTEEPIKVDLNLQALDKEQLRLLVDLSKKVMKE